MILDKDNCRPFDRDRTGINLGEGAAYIVLESEKSAKARGAEILGILSGYANTCDAFHQTASSENGEGAYLAMRKAMDMARLSAFGTMSYRSSHQQKRLPDILQARQVQLKLQSACWH